MRRWLPFLLLTLLAPGLWAGINDMEPMPCGYDSRNGSADPMGFVDGMSLYAGYFVAGGLDPFGLCNKDEEQGAVGPGWQNGPLPVGGESVPKSIAKRALDQLHEILSDPGMDALGPLRLAGWPAKILRGANTIDDLYTGNYVHNGGQKLDNKLSVAANSTKASRQRGVRAGQREERDLVESGHPGTVEGGWTLAERKQIAETGQYPGDTRWHHINDVKRNPGMADKADNVIPSRGGNAGHVEKYHPNGTQAGSTGDLLDRGGLIDQQYGR